MIVEITPFGRNDRRVWPGYMGKVLFYPYLGHLAKDG